MGPNLSQMLDARIVVPCVPVIPVPERLSIRETTVFHFYHLCCRYGTSINEHPWRFTSCTSQKLLPFFFFCLHPKRRNKKKLNVTRFIIIIIIICEYCNKKTVVPCHQLCHWVASTERMRSRGCTPSFWANQHKLYYKFLSKLRKCGYKYL